mmetsp:Transcript_21733/g.62138  ORF Transcript_21733/g.62138 Transcript_21733/m.62138 type:complete len:227 (-) Transcript_21733:112-792(-)
MCVGTSAPLEPSQDLFILGHAVGESMQRAPRGDQSKKGAIGGHDESRMLAEHIQGAERLLNGVGWLACRDHGARAHGLVNGRLIETGLGSLQLRRQGVQSSCDVQGREDAEEATNRCAHHKVVTSVARLGSGEHQLGSLGQAHRRRNLEMSEHLRMLEFRGHEQVFDACCLCPAVEVCAEHLALRQQSEVTTSTLNVDDDRGSPGVRQHPRRLAQRRPLRIYLCEV